MEEAGGPATVAPPENISVSISVATTQMVLFSSIFTTPSAPDPGDAEETPEVNLTTTTDGGEDVEQALPHNLTMMVVMTVIYMLITITGVLGNVATCIVIVRNRIMHTATNYYLFSMAISDLLLLAFGMPDEIYLLWRGRPYIFGEEFCFIRGFTAEISTNASILTIAAFTVERYIGICHPLRSHTMSQLGRVIRSIAVIWVVATACAVPIAIQYGIVFEPTADGKVDPNTAACLIKKRIKLVFEISSVLFFVAPMLLITVLYVCIAVQLKKSTGLGRAVPSIGSHSCSSTNDGTRNKAVIKMLVAVVIAFFLCFAPHQAQRLMAIHGDETNPMAVKLFNILHNISGISYYISTCINPILYHIMSNRFRQAFQVTLESCLGQKNGAGGGLQESDVATFDNFNNGLSSHQLSLQQIGRHRRAMSMQPRPFRNSFGFHHHHSSSSNNSSSCSSQRLYHSQYRSRPFLQKQQQQQQQLQSNKSGTGVGQEEVLKPNGAAHTWV